MIVRLDIKNYTIIESLSITFSPGLNIITGETGSGKSVLLGALGLILGKRADTKTLFDGAKKCVVESEFDVKGYDLASFFEREDLDYDEQVIIRREILPSGKSRAFINDTPASLKQLQSLASHLVDLHQQFDNLGINDPNHQLQMIDALAENEKIIEDYQTQFKLFRQLQSKRESLVSQLQESLKQRDYLEFQLNEFSELDIQIEEDQKLEQELSFLEHSEEIVTTLNEVSAAIESSEHSVESILQSLCQHLAPLVDYHEGVKAIYERLESSILELEDIAREASSMAEDTEYDPGRVAMMKTRMDKINQLLYKHQVDDIAALVSLQEEMSLQVQNYDYLEEAIASTEKDVQKTHEVLKNLANNLSKRRKKVLPAFEKDVNSLLKNLKMEHATFKISFDTAETLQVNGMDRIEFLFAPNKGSSFSAIKSVASGGEISRLSLITKSLVARTMHMPTLIFDEIDSGVSGDVALQMGNMLEKLAEEHQIISITHSPQVAAKAESHFTVYKTIDGESTKAKVKKLEEADRMVEIATMLSSSPPSDAAIQSAKELMGI